MTTQETKRKRGRPPMLDGEVCYTLYQKLGSIAAVRDYLHDTAGIPSMSENGYFTPGAIMHAIKEYKPDAIIYDVRIRAARQQMAKLRKQLLGN